MRKRLLHGVMLIIVAVVAIICTACSRPPFRPSKIYGNWRIIKVNEQSYTEFAEKNNISANQVKWTLEEKSLIVRYSGGREEVVFPISYIDRGFNVLNPDYSIFATVRYEHENDNLYYNVKMGEETYKYILERIEE